MDAYYAIFTPTGNEWAVRFPDAPSIYTCGKNLEDALAMAMDALSGILVVGRKGREYNAPHSYSDVVHEAQKDELVFPVVPNENIMETYRPKKRVNVMVPVDLLENIGEYVKKTDGLDRSKLFCKAATEYMAAHTP